MTLPPGHETAAHGAAADRLRAMEMVVDAALSRLDEQSLLVTLLDRVKKVFEADTAAVLLLDEATGELAVTAASGVEDEVRQAVRIPVGEGFAGKVAATAEPFILTKVDRTTVRSPVLVDRGIKTLLGVPLLAGGKVIGVLHVGSLNHRHFGPQDARLLEVAADKAALAVRSLMSQSDTQAALTLHRSLQPRALPLLPHLGLAARYVTGSGPVGGDWYDVFVLPDGKLGVVMGDVVGSGLEAAAIMGRMRSALRAYVLESAEPATALRMLDRNIQYFEPDAMATALYGLYTPETGEFTISSAGHPPPVMAAPGHRPRRLPVQPDPPIGATDDPQRSSATFLIPQGALLCCFTDGLVERRDQPVDEGIDRLAAVMGRQIDTGPGGPAHPSAERACAAVMRTLVGSAPATDDIAIFMLSRHSGLPSLRG